MKLSVSNIAWPAEQDEAVYHLMKENGFCGLEIAPTRIFTENPYDRPAEARKWSLGLYETYGFRISSMQSIWYGRQEQLFGSDQERRALFDYTRKAIDFAAAMGCRNLVFGCPRNRCVPDDMTADQANDRILPFFKELGDYAFQNGTVVAMEANPPIYHTNFINDTESAIALIKQVDSPGFRLNLDIGTMVENGETEDVIAGRVGCVNHVHISEPNLAVIKKRPIHRDILSLLQGETTRKELENQAWLVPELQQNEANYNGFLSIEMGKQDDISLLSASMKYLSETASWIEASKRKP